MFGAKEDMIIVVMLHPGRVATKMNKFGSPKN